MTAVEWLMEQITYTNEFGCVCNSFIETADLSMYFERAKEMEKQHIIDAYSIGAINGEMIERDLKPKFSNPIHYYNETFKNK